MKKQLFIFAADHRNALKIKILNIKKEPNKKQVETLQEFKDMLLEGLKLAIKNGVPVENCYLLMDEEYGSKQLRLAKANGIKIMVPVEKSRENIFHFNYGRNFKQHIEKFNPDYVKVLLHFNPLNRQDNEKSLKNLRILNNYLKTTNYKFLLEVLVMPTEYQIKKYGKTKFDRCIRPLLTVEAIKELHKSGVHPDVWKLEGYERKRDVDLVTSEIGESNMIILGRSESINKVLKWISIGTKNEKVIGFAVGRTIFMNALQKYYKRKLSREKAIKIMANRFNKIADFYSNSSNRNDSVQ